MKNPESSFVIVLKKILLMTYETQTIQVKDIISTLSLKGYATLLVLLSLPFCSPLQIPGVSTPFGVLIAFLGLRMMFGKELWLPQFLLDKTMSSLTVSKVIHYVLKVVNFLQKFLKERLSHLATSLVFEKFTGFVIFILAIFLSLPLPIPLTNFFAAVPIVCLGLGLLENDGVMILIGYFLAFICYLTFALLFIFSFNQIKSFFHWMLSIQLF